MNDKDKTLLPVSTEEYERQKDAALSNGGVAFDIHGDNAELSLSPEALAIVAEKAAQHGMDTEAFIQMIWQQQVDQIMAKKNKQP